MEQNVREMKSVGVALPKQVIHHKGKTLDGPVIRREQVQKKIMPEDLENKDRAPDQGIVVHEGDVVPDHLALQRRNSDNKTDDAKEQAAQPIFAQISYQSRRLRACRLIVDPNNRGLAHFDCAGAAAGAT
jgi:myo-inositol-1-phosphate synthase